MSLNASQPSLNGNARPVEMFECELSTQTPECGSSKAMTSSRGCPPEASPPIKVVCHAGGMTSMQAAPASSTTEPSSPERRSSNPSTETVMTYSEFIRSTRARGDTTSVAAPGSVCFPGLRAREGVPKVVVRPRAEPTTKGSTEGGPSTASSSGGPSRERGEVVNKKKRSRPGKKARDRARKDVAAGAADLCGEAVESIKAVQRNNADCKMCISDKVCTKHLAKDNELPIRKALAQLQPLLLEEDVIPDEHLMQTMADAMEGLARMEGLGKARKKLVDDFAAFWRLRCTVGLELEKKEEELRNVAETLDLEKRQAALKAQIEGAKRYHGEFQSLQCDILLGDAKRAAEIAKETQKRTARSAVEALVTNDQAQVERRAEEARLMVQQEMRRLRCIRSIGSMDNTLPSNMDFEMPYMSEIKDSNQFVDAEEVVKMDSQIYLAVNDATESLLRPREGTPGGGGRIVRFFTGAKTTANMVREILSDQQDSRFGVVAGSLACDRYTYRAKTMTTADARTIMDMNADKRAQAVMYGDADLHPKFRRYELTERRAVPYECDCLTHAPTGGVLDKVREVLPGAAYAPNGECTGVAGLIRPARHRTNCPKLWTGGVVPIVYETIKKDVYISEAMVAGLLHSSHLKTTCHADTYRSMKAAADSEFRINYDRTIALLGGQIDECTKLGWLMSMESSLYQLLWTRAGTRIGGCMRVRCRPGTFYRRAVERPNLN